MTHRSPSLNSTRSSRLSSWLSGLPQMFDTHQNSRNSSPIDFEYRDEYISDNLDIQQDVQPEVQQINKLDGTESTEKPEIKEKSDKSGKSNFKKKVVKTFKRNSSSESDAPDYRTKEFLALERYRSKKYREPKNDTKNAAEQLEVNLINETKRIYGEKNYNQQDHLENFRQTYKYYVNKSVHQDLGRKYLGSGYPSPIVSSGHFIDAEKLDLIIRCNKLIITKLTKDANVWGFLAQFDTMAPEYELNEKELNTLIFNYMSDDLKAKFMKSYAKHPKDLPTKEFYSNIVSIVVGHPATYSNFETKFNSYDATKVGNIKQIISDLNRILDETPPHVVNEGEKERRLYYRLLPILPWNLQPHWHNLLVPSRYHDENLVPPSRGVQEGFLLNYQDQMNSHLKNMARRRINAIGTKDVKPKKASVKLSSQEDKKNRYPEPCPHCKKRGHKPSECYSHSDPDIRAKNISASRYCLLCRASNHLTPECPKYPAPIEPVSGGCLTCKNNKIMALHPTDRCLGVDDNFLVWLAKKREESTKN